MRILKHRLPGMGGTIDLPNPCSIIHAGEQDGVLFIWTEVPRGAEDKKPTPFCVVPTGGYPPEGMLHCKTVQMQDGLVWHIYFGA